MSTMAKKVVKVKLLVGLAGATNKDPGDRHECSAAEALAA
jgi:hypothetical protein